MIRIKDVDAQNILDVCGLTTDQDGVGTAGKGHCRCNALSIAAATYHPDMHPHAIYHNHLLIGFFMYQRDENQAGTATICRFMLDDRFRHKGLEKKALEHILRGLKIQGVKKVVLKTDAAGENAENLYPSLGFHPAGGTEQTGRRYELEL